MVLRNQFFSATILQLVEYFGLVDLALMLDVDLDDLLRWAEGKDRPPVDVFLRVIDLRNRGVCREMPDVRIYRFVGRVVEPA